MGQTVKVACKFCKSEWECRTGCGILHGDLSQVAGLYPPQQCREIRDYAEQVKYPLFDFGYRLCRCRQCHRIGSVPVLRLEEGATTYVGPCGHCMQEVELIEDVERAECPVCHKETLVEEAEGMWD